MDPSVTEVADLPLGWIAFRNAIGGEWGHNTLPLPSGDDLPLPACYCGRAGCVETYLSGPALARDHRQAGGAALAPEAVVAAAAGDAACTATLQRYLARLARAMDRWSTLAEPWRSAARRRG